MAKNSNPFDFQTILFLSLFFSSHSVFMPAMCGNNATDLQALLAFKAAILSDPLQALTSWNESVHFCSWRDVVCGHKHSDRVIPINLRSQGLVGSLTPYIGNFSFLKSITLQNNSFTGKIPEEIGCLRRLEYIEFSNNSFGGEIPKNLSHCKRLYFINLIDNKLTGRLIPEIGSSLVELQVLGLSKNQLSLGPSPSWIGNLTSLRLLSLINCGLQGQIPESLVNLKRLRELSLSENSLTGPIPLGLFNSSISVFQVFFNQLQGTIPPDVGRTLPNIEVLNLAFKNFSGEIPASLLNASSLRHIILDANNFRGPMLRNFERLTNLATFSVPKNSIQGDVRSFISSLTNCTRLIFLDAGHNLLDGSLPNSMANLSTNLVSLVLQYNDIHGRLPSGIDNLLNLAHIVLSNNDLSVLRLRNVCCLY